MQAAKKYKVLAILALVVIAILAVVSFFVTMYRNDVRQLADFSAAYQKYNTAITNFQSSSGSEQPSTEAFAQLNAVAANMRLSSLIKHDAELTDQARVVAGISGQELSAASAHKGTTALTAARMNAYAQFQSLLE